MPLVEARRFLHACYVCRDADAAARFLAEGLGLRAAMRSAGGSMDGSILGLPRDVETEAVFVFDARGPRTSPALEVQGWIDPPPVGTPYAGPERVGLQAFGVAVRDAAAARERLLRLGSRPAGAAQDAKEILGSRAAALRDPLGIGVDVVESAELEAGATRLCHLRATCRDLDRSVDWYAELGFELFARHAPVELPPGLLGAAPGRVRVARMRLPDEPLALVLVQWLDPPSAGQAYAEPNHVGLYRVAVAVDDTRDAVRRLAGAGRPVERPPRLVELAGTKVPDMWIAFLRDPDGIPVELVERPRSAFKP
jgi:catechol 2,3-dioxygenase-like lactoylglutathione lyase family enzyme